MSDAAGPPDLSVESLMEEVAEEFVERLHRGEQPDVEEYARRYPPIATFLRQMLPTLLLMRSGSVLEPALPIDLSPSAPGGAGCLGDYRVLRELGRGGMGVVYEAEQISLGRRVALKVLPFAAALDAQQLQRFKNEAQAAAHLHHTNIVQVFGVGCDRGVHYYAMQLIDGQTLAAVIRELRRLTGPGAGEPAAPAAAPTAPVAALATERSTDGPAYFRSVARLGLQGALALEHAHAEGVLHRDIKPANLLVNGRGSLWVTDFGLARLAGEAGLTRTGDLVGTLRYMSPEQALGQHRQVDERTDVYALGATLYELLTLEPVHDGADRQVLLRQIGHEEPRPPRRLNPAVPADLETVLLKALAKEPAGRYPTARELADDLRRFLEDKAIRARRPTAWQRARKWLRRHRSVAATAAVLGVLAVAGLAAGTVLLWREQERTRAALREAEANYRLAEAQRRQARRAVDEMYTQFAQRWLEGEPGREQVQREFLLKALHFYEEFAREQRDDPAVGLEAARAYRRVGDVQQKLGRHALAEEAYGRALDLLRPLAEQAPTARAYRYELAGCRNNLGSLLARTGRPREAEKPLRQSLALYQTLADETSPRFRYELASSYGNLGLVLEATGKPGEAEQAYEHALALREQLVAEAPDEPDHRRVLALTHYTRGEQFAATGRSRKAEKAYRRALALQEDLAKIFPASPTYRGELAATLSGLGTVLAGTGPSPGAEEAFRRASELQRRLAADFPGRPDYRYALALSHHRQGTLFQVTGRHAEAEKALGQALALLEKLAADFPAVPEYPHQLARSSFNLGALLADTGRPREAEKPLRHALEVYEGPGAGWEADHRHERAGAYNTLGRALRATGRAKEAEQAYRQALALWEGLAGAFPAVPDHESNQGGALHNLARLRNDQGDPEGARALAERAIRHQRRALEGDPGHSAYRRLLRDHYRVLAEALTRLGRHAEAARAAGEMPKKGDE
jgi:serine/threonine protein kinase/Tfp pilus assembly protein PilF